MKKLAALVLACALMLLSAGCSSGKDGKTLNIPTAELIVLRCGNTLELVEITDAEDIRRITENFNSLQYEKGEPRENYTGWSYWLEWYNGDDPIESIVVMGPQRIEREEYFYSVSGGEVDTAFFDEMLEKLADTD